MNFELSNRLRTCLEFLSGFESIADIGTDHGLLPAYGILNHHIKTAIAADIGQGPLQMAKKTISKYHLKDAVQLRLGPGLSVLKAGEVQGAVIAGMGGKLICSILGEGLEVAKSCRRLVLQPNVDAHLIRRALMGWGFRIVHEALILEDGKYYEIVVAEPTPVPPVYTEDELDFGPSLLKNRQDPVFQKYWQEVLGKQRLILSRLPQGHPKFEGVKQKYDRIQEVLEG